MTDVIDRRLHRFVQDAFGTPDHTDARRRFILPGNDEVSAGYEVTYGMSSNYLIALRSSGGWKRAICITQEFGTKSGVEVR